MIYYHSGVSVLLEFDQRTVSINNKNDGIIYECLLYNVHCAKNRIYIILLNLHNNTRS